MDNNKLNNMFAEEFANKQAKQQQSGPNVEMERMLSEMKIQYNMISDQLNKMVPKEKLKVPSSVKRKPGERTISEDTIQPVISTATDMNFSSIEQAERFIAEEKAKISKRLIEDVLVKTKKQVREEIAMTEADEDPQSAKMRQIQQQLQAMQNQLGRVAMSAGSSSGGGAVKLYDLDDTDYNSVKSPLAGDVLTWDAVLGRWVAAPAVPTGSWVHETMTIGAANQLVYNILTLPILPAATYVTMNGIVYNTADYFTLVGTTLTLDSTFFGAAGPVDIKTTDQIVVSYVA